MSYTPAPCDPSTIRPVSPGVFAIDSAAGTGSYLVDVTHTTCNCPHFVKRLSEKPAEERQCKHWVAVMDHLTAAKQQEAAEKAQRAEKFETFRLLAGSCTDAELIALRGKYEVAGRFDIALAIMGEQYDREQVSRLLPGDVAGIPATSLDLILARAASYGRNLVPVRRSLPQQACAVRWSCPKTGSLKEKAFGPDELAARRYLRKVKGQLFIRPVLTPMSQAELKAIWA